MAVETNYTREVRKWDIPKRDGGMRPDSFQEFPVMVYRARRPPNGGPPLVFNPSDDSWSMQNTQTARDEEERQRFYRQGWAATPVLAVEAFHAAEDEVAKQAAHRAHDDRRMGELAKREIEAAVAESGMEHDPEIKAKRTYKKRQPKAQTPAA